MLKKKIAMVWLIIICLILALACTACSQGEGKNRNEDGVVDSDGVNAPGSPEANGGSADPTNSDLDDNQGNSSSNAGESTKSQENSGLDGINGGSQGNTGDGIDEDSLESWVGDYSYTEYAPPDQNMFYSLIIYEENHDYYADIYIDGFQTAKRLRAKVAGNGLSVDLIFDSYLPDSMFDIYEEGDILLSFTKSGSRFLTSWGEIEPMLLEDDVKDQEHFEKTEYPILIMRFNNNIGMDDSYDVLQLTDDSVTYSYYDYSDPYNPELKEKTVPFSEMLGKDENGIDKFIITMFSYDGFNVRELELTDELNRRIKEDPEFRRKLGVFVGNHFDRQLENDIIDAKDIDP